MHEKDAHFFNHSSMNEQNDSPAVDMEKSVPKEKKKGFCLI